MPHIVLEQSANISSDIALPELLLKVHQIVSTTGGISLANCKSRCRVLDLFCVGDGNHANAFVHLDVRFVEGRSQAVRQQIGEELKVCLQVCFENACKTHDLQITVEVRDILLNDYHKYPDGTLTQQ